MAQTLLQDRHNAPQTNCPAKTKTNSPPQTNYPEKTNSADVYSIRPTKIKEFLTKDFEVKMALSKHC